MLKIEIEGWNESDLHERLVRAMVERYHDELAAHVRERVEAAVDERLSRLADEHLREAVAQIVREGFQQTNSYGEATGPRVTLKDRIGQYLAGRDSYDRKSRIDAVFEKLLGEALNRELGEELKRAREAFRAQVDGVLQAKLTESLRSALGLKA